MAPSPLCLLIALLLPILQLCASPGPSRALLQGLIEAGALPNRPITACFALTSALNVSEGPSSLQIRVSLQKLSSKSVQMPPGPFLCWVGQSQPKLVLLPNEAQRLLRLPTNSSNPNSANADGLSLRAPVPTAGPPSVAVKTPRLTRTQVVVITTLSAIIGTFFILAALLRFRGYLQRKQIIQRFLPPDTTKAIRQPKFGSSRRIRRPSETQLSFAARRRATYAGGLDAGHSSGALSSGASHKRRSAMRRSASLRMRTSSVRSSHVPPVVSLPHVDLPSVHSPRSLQRCPPAPTAYFPGLLGPNSAIACECQLALLGWPCVHKRFLRRMLNPLYDPSLKSQVEAAKREKRAAREKKRREEEARRAEEQGEAEEEAEEAEEGREEGLSLRSLRGTQETVVEVSCPQDEEEAASSV